jgi:hypothetical protein
MPGWERMLWTGDLLTEPLLLPSTLLWGRQDCPYHRWPGIGLARLSIANSPGSSMGILYRADCGPLSQASGKSTVLWDGCFGNSSTDGGNKPIVMTSDKKPNPARYLCGVFSGCWLGNPCSNSENKDRSLVYEMLACLISFSAFWRFWVR